MEFHTIYRASGPENPSKRRPPFYSKLQALKSFVTALEFAPPGDRIFVHDGPVPLDRAEIANEHGDILALGGVGNSASYRTCVSLAQSRQWKDDDLVYFAEDDYLHVPHALQHLARAAKAIPNAEYFTLYDSPDYRRLVRHRVHQRLHANSTMVDGLKWREVRSTCLTYGARVGAIRRDAWLHHLCSRHRAPADYAIWSVLARDGIQYALPRLLLPATRPDLLRVVRGWLRSEECPTAVRLYAVTPGLASHLETGMLSPGVDWAKLARQTDASSC